MNQFLITTVLRFKYSFLVPTVQSRRTSATTLRKEARRQSEIKLSLFGAVVLPSMSWNLSPKHLQIDWYSLHENLIVRTREVRLDYQPLFELERRPDVQGSEHSASICRLWLKNIQWVRARLLLPEACSFSFWNWFSKIKGDNNRKNDQNIVVYSD